jgi:CheY-like chemotaxis protein
MLWGFHANLAYGPAETPGRPRPPSVLVVEDEVLIRMAVAEYLRDCGYRVIEAGNGDEAVAVLKADRYVDVVFSDVSMPGEIDGFALAQWVRRELPAVRVILTSGIRKTARAASDLCEDSPLLDKPYDHAEVERRIRALLATREES